MEHVAQITEQATEKLCVFIDIQHMAGDISIFEALAAVHMVERRTPNRPPLRVAVIEADSLIVKTIRVIHTLIGRKQDQFRVFLPTEADTALSWLIEECR